MNTIAVHTERNRTDGLVTTLVGDLDADTAPEFGLHLDRLGAVPDVVDLRFVPFMGAAGITSLLHARQGRDFRVIPSPAVLRILELCGLSHLAVDDDQKRMADLPALLEASFGVSVLDESLRYLYANEAVAELHRRSSKAHIGRRPDQVLGVGFADLGALIRRALVAGRAIEEFADDEAGQVVGVRSVHPTDFAGRTFAVVIERPRLADANG